MMPSYAHRILIVEDDADLCALVAETLTDAGFEAVQISSGHEALEYLDQHSCDGLAIDLRLPDARGLEVLASALSRRPHLVAVVMTGCGGVPEAVAATKLGACDFLVKPFPIDRLCQIFEAEFDRRGHHGTTRDDPSPRQRTESFDGIIGVSPAMQQLFTMLERVAPLQGTVLIQGETGTGKELVARTLHRRSPRAHQPFVAFSAAAIPDTLAEAELFGHTKGAFTGAVAQRVGRLELAHRGTLFIDEVALMPLPLQAKLLRALQEREIERVGDARPIKFDARIIAATNTDLYREVKEGRFREDLYYRLNVIRITLPPLRERREDVALLARHFVQKSCRQNNLPLKTLSPQACQKLVDHPWPGNIRQLENAIEHAVAMSGRLTEIPASALPPELDAQPAPALVPTVTIPDEGIDFASVVSQLERELILRCLEKTGGNKRQAARLLQLSRTTLIDKLHRLNIDARVSAA